MAVSKKQKQDILSTLVDRFGRSKSVVFAANRGLSVSEVTELRRNLHESGVDFQVAKKTLLLKACADSSVEGMEKGLLDGAVGAAFSYEDEIINAKLLAKFAKDHENLVLIAAIMDGKVIGQDEVIALAKLPSKEELLAKFMGSLQSPLSGFVGISNSLLGGLVMALNGLKEKLEESGDGSQEPGGEKTQEPNVEAENLQPKEKKPEVETNTSTDASGSPDPSDDSESSEAAENPESSGPPEDATEGTEDSNESKEEA